MNKPILDAALIYLSMGFAPIPVKPDKKGSYIKWQDYQDKFPTETEVKTWFSQWDNAMIGIITGKLSKLYVVDCDSQEAYETVSNLIPDSALTPVAMSPRGGYHIWFTGDDDCLPTKSALIPDVDTRGNGGMIISPPSINQHGKSYQWLKDISIHKVKLLDVSKTKILEDLIYKNTKIFEKKNSLSLGDGDFCNVDEMMFQKGRRDQDLFEVGMALADSHFTQARIAKVIDILAKNCSIEFPKEEAMGKVKWVLERLAKKERNLAKEVRDLFYLTNNLHSINSILQILHIITKQEKSNLMVILHRLQQEGIIEKAGRAEYRLISKENDAMDLQSETDVKEFPVIMPCNLNDMCVISPGNIIMVAGTKSAGKTAFLMNIAKLNMRSLEVIYLNSEMHETEFKKRMKSFGNEFSQLKNWNIKGYNCHGNYHDKIDGKPSKIYIVDYLEISDEFYKVAQMIRAIHEKLGDSICFIGLQMKSVEEKRTDGLRFGRGGDFSAEKSRLYLSMDYFKEKKASKLTIVDAKEPRGEEHNLRGWHTWVKIIKGSRLQPFCEDGEKNTGFIWKG